MSARPNPRLRRVPVSMAGLRVQTARSEEQIARIREDVRATRRVTLGEYWAAQREEAEADHYAELEAEAEVIVGRALSSAFPPGTPGHKLLVASDRAAARALAIASPQAPARAHPVDLALADVARRTGDTPASTSAADPLPASAVDSPVGEGPLQPSPTAGPYHSTPYFEGGWLVLGADGQQIGHTNSITTVQGVVAALNDAYRRGLAEGGAR